MAFAVAERRGDNRPAFQCRVGLEDWGSARVPRAGSGVAPEPLVDSFSLGDGFPARRRKRQPGRSRSPFKNRSSRCESAHYFAGRFWMERTDVRCYAGNVAAARQGVQTGTEFGGRLSPECRCAETVWSRLSVRNSKLSGLLFRFSFWDGRCREFALAQIKFPPKMAL